MDTIVPEAARRARDIRGEFDFTDWDREWYRPLVQPRTASYVYVVIWPESRVIKAGITSREARWRTFLNRGAVLVGLFPGYGVSLERFLLRGLEVYTRRAFSRWQESVPWLGAGGTGYSECFRFEMDEYKDIEDLLTTAKLCWRDKVAA